MVFILMLSAALAADTVPAAARVRAFETSLKQLYDECALDRVLEYETFRLAMIGYYNLIGERRLSRTGIITIVDYEKKSTEPRLLVVDLESRSLRHHTLVAHGKRTGENHAEDFSNDAKSLMSSLGFYVTGGTYSGRHGYSLILKGLEAGFNSNAESRSIVMHGADYVSLDFARKQGRIGRSWGCPAVPTKVHRAVIDDIKGGTALFSYHRDEDYLEQSKYLSLIGAIDAYWRCITGQLDDAARGGVHEHEANRSWFC